MLNTIKRKYIKFLYWTKYNNKQHYLIFDHTGYYEPINSSDLDTPVYWYLHNYLFSEIKYLKSGELYIDKHTGNVCIILENEITKEDHD